MSRRERDKGRKGEAEVRAVYERHGFTVRGLEGLGDHLVTGHGRLIHSEVKRHEVLRLPLWARQAVAEAPLDALPVVAFRRSREPWRAIVPEECVGLLLAVAGEAVTGPIRSRSLNGALWYELSLDGLLAGLVAASRLSGLVGATQ